MGVKNRMFLKTKYRYFKWWLKSCIKPLLLKAIKGDLKHHFHYTFKSYCNAMKNMEMENKFGEEYWSMTQREFLNYKW